jgi:DnaJ-class molecular chaperone
MGVYGHLLILPKNPWSVCLLNLYANGTGGTYISRARVFRGRGDEMAECVECGEDLNVEERAHVCGECAARDLVDMARQGGGKVSAWVECPLCSGSGRCFYCSPGGPCYHCSGSGREQPGSAEECHICGGDGDVDKGCDMCGHTRRCRHCAGTGRVPADVLRGIARPRIS